MFNDLIFSFTHASKLLLYLIFTSGIFNRESASSFILSKIPILCQEVFLSERLILLFVFQNAKNLCIRLNVMSDTGTT